MKPLLFVIVLLPVAIVASVFVLGYLMRDERKRGMGRRS